VASGLPLAGFDGPAARPRFAVGAALASGMAAEAELLDAFFVDRLPRWRVREALEPVLPEGHALVDVHDVWLGEPALPGQVVASVYRATIGADAAAAASVRAAASAMLAAEALPRLRTKGEGQVAYDLRPFLDGLEVEDAAGRLVVRMRLVHDPERGIGRPDEVLAELAERLGRPLEVDALVRERIVLRSPSSAPPPQPPSASRNRPRK
jgi:radical SAM-linked protein